MSAVLPAVLAGGAVALAGGLPGRAALRLHALAPTRDPAPSAAVGTRGHLPRLRPVALLALGVAGLLLLGPGVVLVALVVAAGGSRLLAARARARTRAEEWRGAVEACAALAAELRTGSTSAQALGVAAALARGPSQEALRAAAAAAQWGGDVPAVLLAEASSSCSVPEVLRGLAACWQVCTRAGSGLAAAVERLAEGLRARQAQERAVEAALAGPRASAGLLALLPLMGIALAAGLGARPVHVLLHTPLGVACLVAGTGLDTVGLWWTGRLVSHAAGSRG